MAGNWTIREISRPDGVKIRYGVWGDPKVASQALLFLNGRTEWIEKYDFLPEMLKLRPDTIFVAMDHRGQGASGGPRAHVGSYEYFAEDVKAVVEAAIGKDMPYGLLAHSMGSLIGLYSVLTGRIRPFSAVLCAPLLGLPEAPIPGVIARPLSRCLSLTPLTTVSSGAGQMDKAPFARNRLTHSKEMFDKITHSPYPLRGVTFGWVRATFEAIDRVHSHEALKSLTVPVLVLVGSDERVVKASAFSPWVQLANQCAKAPVDFVSVHGGRHELLSEIPEYRNQAISIIRQKFQRLVV